MKPVVEFDEAAHAYKVNGRPVPSVTQVITRTIGSGFEAIRDPAYYKQRGRAVHACGAFKAAGVEFEHDPAIDGWVQALHKFWREVQPKPILWETPLGSARYLFAGTPDLLADMGVVRYLLADYKGSLSPHRCRIQLGGYSIALYETLGIECNYGIGVHLRGDGTYRATAPFDLRTARNEFLALRTTYAILEQVHGEPKEQE